jgi:hypothetical protein
MWEIPFDRVQLLGGYTADFSQRNPWAHPTQLLWEQGLEEPAEAGAVLVRAKEVVIDGITIDMRSHNEYVDPQAVGAQGAHADYPAISLTPAGTVRNCVVVNPGQECV